MQPLQSLLVVAIEQAVAAPLCTSRLAAAGARVIKIEREEGDFARNYDTAAGGDSSYFTWLNQGKESACLNFKEEGDASVLRNLLGKADVLVSRCFKNSVFFFFCSSSSSFFFSSALSSFPAFLQ